MESPINLDSIIKNPNRQKIFDMILEEACRQWYCFIDEAPERADGEGFAQFFYEVFETKEQEYMENLGINPQFGQEIIWEGEHKVIEFDRWKPCADDPRKVEYAGQRTAQEVYEELKHRLDGMGYLPDEYFLMGDEWKNGREIPQEADLFCTVDYGESEGVYVDVYLKWYDEERGNPLHTH